MALRPYGGDDMSESYDLVVIGGGSAGLTAAGFASELEASVALIEGRRLGGDCTWTGCIPSKALIHEAGLAHTRGGTTTDFGVVMNRVAGIVDSVYRTESPEELAREGVEVIGGSARFLDRSTVEAGDRKITAGRFLVCTGARPFLPPIPGIGDVPLLTYESIWDIRTLPDRLVIVGGGPIGCEMAQAFSRLGSKVTILAGGSDRILPRDEPEASDVIAGVFKSEGIEILLGTRAESFRMDGDRILVDTEKGEIGADQVLLAVGRRPVLDGLDLEKAGVRFSPKGIEVDRHLQTSAKNIFAAGDCLGSFQFTHYAGWQAFTAVRNALLPGRTDGVKATVPWTTFTDPEVAHTGLGEADAREKHGDSVMVCRWPMDRVDRARTDGRTEGFVKIVHLSDGTVLGATVVSPRAGEMIQEWTLACDHGLKVGDVAGSIHVYPTYSTGNMQAAARIRISQLLGGLSGRVLKGLSRLIR